jgi:hypothetical protein
MSIKIRIQISTIFIYNKSNCHNRYSMGLKDILSHTSLVSVLIYFQYYYSKFSELPRCYFIRFKFLILWRLNSSGMWHVVGCVVPDTLKKCIPFHVQGQIVKEDPKPWRWRHYVPSNCQELWTKWQCHITKELNLQKHHHKNLKSCILIFCSSSRGYILARFSSSKWKSGICEINIYCKCYSSSISNMKF